MMTNDIRSIIEQEADAVRNIPISERYAEAVDLIVKHVHKQGGTLITAGMGKAGQIAMNMATTFSSTGTPAFFLPPGEAQHGDLGIVRRNDLLLLVSNSGKTLERDFDYIREALRYEQLVERHHPIDVPDYVELRAKVMRLKVAADADGFERTPSHNDFYPPNFLVAADGHIDLIDWEYAGMSDIASDFGTLVVCTQMSVERADEAIGYYFDRTPTTLERRHFWSYVVFAGWCWYVWALAKEAEGDDAGQDIFTYYRHVTDYVDALLSWYEGGEEAVPEVFAGGAD